MSKSKSKKKRTTIGCPHCGNSSGFGEANIVNATADVLSFDEDGEHGVGVVDGKECVEYVGGQDGQVILGQEAVGDEVRVGEHDALGFSRRPRGEEYGRKILGQGLVPRRTNRVPARAQAVHIGLAPLI